MLKPKKEKHLGFEEEDDDDDNDDDVFAGAKVIWSCFILRSLPGEEVREEQGKRRLILMRRGKERADEVGGKLGETQSGMARGSLSPVGK